MDTLKLKMDPCSIIDVALRGDVAVNCFELDYSRTVLGKRERSDVDLH